MHRAGSTHLQRAAESATTTALLGFADDPAPVERSEANEGFHHLLPLLQTSIRRWLMLEQAELRHVWVWNMCAPAQSHLIKSIHSTRNLTSFCLPPLPLAPPSPVSQCCLLLQASVPTKKLAACRPTLNGWGKGEQINPSTAGEKLSFLSS